MKARVLVFGSINTDYVTYLDVLPAPGETVGGGRFASFAGGKGANQAVAAARSGASVEMYGYLGDDAAGGERLRGLAEAGVGTDHVLIQHGVHSGIAQILVDSKGENMIAVADGANASLGAEDVSLPDDAGEGVVCLFQNEIPQPTTESLIAACHERGMTVVWNVAPACAAIPPVATLAAVDCLVCNRSELAALAGKGDPEDAAGKLLALGVGGVIVTLGADGSLLVSSGGTHRQPAFPVTAVDTVGAGDCFCGYLAASLAAGMEMKPALRQASAAAALACCHEGAQDAMPPLAEVTHLLESSEEGD